MFSSFDFLCAELLGHKVKAVYAPSPSASSSSSGAAASTTTMEEKAKSVQQKKNSDAGEKAEARQQRKTPRFAPELDGLNCFETLVPY